MKLTNWEKIFFISIIIFITVIFYQNPYSNAFFQPLKNTFHEFTGIGKNKIIKIKIPQVKIIAESKIEKYDTSLPQISKIETKKEIEIVFAKKVILVDVPFIMQAPYSNWKIHRESCEEASMLMIHNYLSGYNNIDMRIIDLTLREMKEYQKTKLGEEKDLYNEELVEFIKEYFKYKKVNGCSNATLKDIKEKIFQGIPVIVSVIAGKLHNPHYTYSGYHVLVAIGYDDDKQQIITNDPGTRNGKMFSYNYFTFESAMVKENGGIITIEDLTIKTVSKNIENGEWQKEQL